MSINYFYDVVNERSAMLKFDLKNNCSAMLADYK